MGSDFVKMRPCSIENSWSICMNRGSFSCRERPDSGRWSRTRDDLFRVRCGLRLPISGSGFRPGVHRPGKYRFNRLFLKNNGFASDLSLQFSGLWLVVFSATPFQVIRGEKGDGKGHGCLIMQSRRRTLRNAASIIPSRY